MISLLIEFFFKNRRVFFFFIDNYVYYGMWWGELDLFWFGSWDFYLGNFYNIDVMFCLNKKVMFINEFCKG